MGAGDEWRGPNSNCGRVQHAAPKELPDAASGASVLANWVKKHEGEGREVVGWWWDELGDWD